MTARIGAALTTLRAALDETRGTGSGWATKLCVLVTTSLDVDGAILYRADAVDRVLRVEAMHPFVTEAALFRMPLGFGIIGRVAAEAMHVVLVDDAPRDPVHRRLLGLSDGATVARACVPVLAAGDVVLGVLAVHARRSRRFDHADVAVLHDVAAVAALRWQRDRIAAEAKAADLAAGRLVAVTLAAQEADRARMAADLHDGITQTIVSLAFHLCAAQDALGATAPQRVRAQLAHALRLADLAVDEARQAALGLRPPVFGDLGLGPALESLARSVPQLPIQVDVSDVTVAEHVMTSLYRAAQEAIQNAVKHAAATRVFVRLAAVGDTAVLTVSDDGRGMAGTGSAGEPEYGQGLPGIEQRIRLLGGSVSIDSRRDHGTTVRVVVPRARRAGD